MNRFIWQNKEEFIFGDESKFQEWIEKQPPRSGLVPKTGDWQHPGRWIRPEKDVIPSEKKPSIEEQPRFKQREHRTMTWVRPEGKKSPLGIPIPPGLTDVWIPTQEDYPLQFIGTAANGKRQYTYSDKHNMEKEATKFSRTKQLSKDLKSLMKRINKDVGKFEEADIMYAIAATAIRVGRDKEILARQKAYGMTTLLNEHVTIGDNSIRFAFPSKKGGFTDLTFEDPKLIEIFKVRKIGKEDGERIFEATDNDVRKYLHSISGKQYSPKDFRTYAGTNMALELMNSMPMPTNQKELKVAKKEIYKIVSECLANTPGVSQKHYINKEVFAPWDATALEWVNIKKSIKNWQTMEDVFSAVHYPIDTDNIEFDYVEDDEDEEELEKQRQIAFVKPDEGYNMYHDKDQDLQKVSPPRPGLVPKTGDPSHPGRWVKPTGFDIGRTPRTAFTIPQQQVSFVKPFRRSVKAFILDKHDRILVLKDQMTRYWELPGGQVLAGETLLDGLKREVKEETKLDITGIQRIGAGKLEVNRWLITFYTAHAIGEIQLSSEHAAYHWVSKEELSEFNFGIYENVIRQFFANRALTTMEESPMASRGVTLNAELGDNLVLDEELEPDDREGAIRRAENDTGIYAIDKLGMMFEKVEKSSRRGYHGPHDGFPEHPVAVKDHVNYFAYEEDDEIEDDLETESPLQISDRFSEGERNIFEKALNRLPQLVKGLTNGVIIKKDARIRVGAVYNPDTNNIQISPQVFEEPDYLDPAYLGLEIGNLDAAEIIAIHESAHAIHANMPYDMVQKWKENVVYRLQDLQYDLAITEYARKDIHEYFAESFTYYLLGHKKLRQVVPDVYRFFNDWIKLYDVIQKQLDKDKIGVGAAAIEDPEIFRQYIDAARRKTQLSKADQPDAYTEDFYVWIDNMLEKSGLSIPGDQPRGAKSIGKNIEARLYGDLRDAVNDYLQDLTGDESRSEVIEEVRKIVEKWEKESLPAVSAAFEALFKKGFVAGALAAGDSGKMGTFDENAMNVLEQGKYRIGSRIRAFADDAIKEFQIVVWDSFTPEGVFSLDSLVKEMHERVPAERYKLARIARTETSNVSQLGRIWAWNQDENKHYYNYRWSTVPDNRQKEISRIRAAYGDLTFNECKFLWLNQEQRLPNGKWQNDTFNNRCSVTRYLGDGDERKGSRFDDQRHLFRQTMEVTF